MNKNTFNLAIIGLLVLNLGLLAFLILRGPRPSVPKDEPPSGEPAPAAAATSPQLAPSLAPPPPRPQPIQLLTCQQVALSSNRLVRLRLRFSGPVDTNSLANNLSFRADGMNIASRLVGADAEFATVLVDLLDSVSGTLVTAYLKAGTLPVPGSALLLPSERVQLGCNLSPGLAVSGVSTKSSIAGSSICIELNQPATAENVANFIRIVPAVEFSVSVQSRSYWDDASVLSLTGSFEAGRKYSVTLAAGLRGRGGETLVKPITRSVVFPSLEPACVFASPGRYLAPSDDFIVPIRVANITNVAVTAEHLLPANIVQFVMRETKRYDNWYNWNNDEEDNAERLAVTAAEFSIPVHAPRDKVTVIPCPLGAKLDARKRGAYLVTLRPTSDRGPVESVSRVICASDIGLSLLLQKESGVARVWVTTLSTGAARAGVQVTLYSDRNEILGRDVSNTSGLAEIRFDAKKEPVAVVGFDPRDWDRNFVSVANETSVNFVQSGERDFVSADGYEAFVFTDRGIFRPGETVFVQALLRDGHAAAPATTFPVELRVTKPDGKLFRKLTLMPDARGSLHAEVAIPEYLPSGCYTAMLRLPGPDGKVLGEANFLVESFVPPQIKVAVAPSRETARLGDEVAATISSEHLYGAPAEGLRVEGGVTFLPLDFKPAGWERYAFGDRSVKFNAGVEKKFGEARLDAEGRHTVSFAVPGDLRAPVRARAKVRGTVIESGGRPVTAYGSVVVDTAPYYLGLDTTGRDWLKSEEEVSIPWAAVRPDGSPEPGVASLAASLIRIDSHWSFTVGDNGRYEWHRETTESKVLEARKVPPCGADGKGLFSFKVPEWGDYRLILSDTKTGASASYTFWASWGGDRPTATDSFTKLEITTDRKSYAPGENARLQIRSPFAGTLFLVIKQDKVLQARAIAITNKTVEVVLPVTASIAPGVEVVASVARAAKAEEVWSPHRAVGTCFVGVQPPEHELRVAVEVPEVIRPSATAEVAIRVTSADGTAPADAHVTLFAVDEGICGLTDLKTPDPTAFFFASRKGDFDYYDVYTRLMQVTDAKLTGFLSHTGGDAGLDLGKRLNPVSARRFRPVSLKTYDVAVTNGVAVIPVAVPEFTGQLRFMAIAWTASATGSGEAFARVRRNLVVQPDLPRVLAPGDKSFLSISLDNTTASSIDVAFAVAGEGPVAVGKAPAPFTMAGRTRRTVTVPVEATEGIGVARVKVRVEGSGEVFEDEIEIPVRPAAPWRTVNASVSLTPGESTDFKPVPDILASSASQLVEVLSHPFCDVRAALGYLTTYPYGCAEQTTSAAFPFLSVGKMPEGFFEDEMRVRAESFVNAAVVRDLTMLRYGGFSMWPDGNDVSSFATYYVTLFLAEARRAGYARDLIDVDALESILNVRRWDDADDDELCYIALDRALLGKPDKAMMSNLFESRAALSAESRGQLARAFILAGDPHNARTLLDEAAAPPDLRAAAFLLSAWVELDPANARCVECVERINAAVDRKAGHWGTTQDNALAINALVAYTAAHGNDGKSPAVSASLAVQAGSSQETVVFPQGASATWKSREGQGNADLHVTNTGDSTCYVRRALTAVPLVTADPPASNGLQVVREYLDREGRAIDLAKVRQGDIVVVRLTMASADERDDLVIEDLLPACLEPECHNLVTEGGLAWLPQSDDWRWVSHTEFRDDRVLLFSGEVEPRKTYTWHYSARAVSAGDYIVPAVQASAMYDPRVFARGAATRLTVEK